MLKATFPGPNTPWPSHGCIIAGTSSACGKTTFCLGLLALLSAKNIFARSFKVGPDCLDLYWHNALTQKKGENLDAFLLHRLQCLSIVSQAFDKSFDQTSEYLFPKIAVVEGAMGLFDGLAHQGEKGSTAQMAKWLGFPIILILNAQGLGRSIAALASGYLNFDQEIRFAGIICNNISSLKHEQILRESLNQHCPKIRQLGFLYRNKQITLPSRHLGLHTDAPKNKNELFKTELQAWVEEGLDLTQLLTASRLSLQTNTANSSSSPSVSQSPEIITKKPVPTASDLLTQDPCRFPDPPEDSQIESCRIAVAMDEAFFIYFESNLRALREAGAELCYFSPLNDHALPDSVHAVLIGGGYPELYAAKLAANNSMLTNLRNYAHTGGILWGSGGGFILLMESLSDLEGQHHQMAALFQMQAIMQKKLHKLGYRQLRLAHSGVFGCAGTLLRGHEFRYSRSQLTNSLNKGQQTLVSLAEVSDPRQEQCLTKLYSIPQGNVIGSFIHIHLLSSLNATRSFITSCLQNSRQHQHKN